MKGFLLANFQTINVEIRYDFVDFIRFDFGGFESFILVGQSIGRSVLENAFFAGIFFGTGKWDKTPCPFPAISNGSSRS